MFDEDDKLADQITARIKTIMGDRYRQVFAPSGVWLRSGWPDDPEDTRLLKIDLEPCEVNEGITFMDLWQISEALGTTDINLTKPIRRGGFSEYTPSWTDEGAVYIRNPVLI